MLVRSAMHRAGTSVLANLLQGKAPAADQQILPCKCGRQTCYKDLRSKTILTVLGEVEVTRPYYLCAHCHDGQFPADTELDIVNTVFSPGVRRMQALVGLNAPFDQGRKQMKLLAGLEVTTKAVERNAEAIGEDIATRERAAIGQAVLLNLPVVEPKVIPVLYIQMDGTGIPVTKKETEGRQGKSVGQQAHTREVKVGCSFTQTTHNAEGCAIRDSDSTTYVAAIEKADEFGNRIYLEAWKRGWNYADRKVVMGDGAEWIWNLADIHFPGAIQILDIFHAREHLWSVARKLHPNEEAIQKRWMMVHQDLLDKCKIKKLVAALRSIQTTSVELAEKLETEANYFTRNAKRMRYPKFRRMHLFIGTGVIEAGCKTVIGSRCKQSGMFWTLRGANAILALRCTELNGRFEDYWEARLAS